MNVYTYSRKNPVTREKKVDLFDILVESTNLCNLHSVPQSHVSSPRWVHSENDAESREEESVVQLSGKSEYSDSVQILSIHNKSEYSDSVQILSIHNKSDLKLTEESYILSNDKISTEKSSISKDIFDSRNSNDSKLSVEPSQASMDLFTTKNCGNYFSKFCSTPVRHYVSLFDDTDIISRIILPKDIININHSKAILSRKTSHFHTSILFPSANESLLPAPEIREENIITDVEKSLLLEFKDGKSQVKDISPLDRVLRLCNPPKIVPFSESYNWDDYKCRKIGEGSFGEVFSINEHQKMKLRSIVKIVPINMDHKCNDVFSEMIISRRLNDLNESVTNSSCNFVMLQRCCVAKGKYPEILLKAWDSHDIRIGSLNFRPEFSDEDLAIILQLEHAGVPIDNFTMKNAVEAISIFNQSALSLAVAEEKYCFEHRDLHSDNILITKVGKTKKFFYNFKGQKLNISAEGVQVKIIDFTISRMEGDCVIFTDLETETSMFEQTGDYQYDVYRKMREVLNNCWREYNPMTNVFWLHYLIKKLIGYDYCNKSSKIHRECMDKLKDIEKNVLQCQNSAEVVEHFVIN